MRKEALRKQELAQEIKTGREQLGLDQERFAEMLEISPRTLQRYEAGKSVPDAITYKIILGLFQNIYFQESAFINAARSRTLIATICKTSFALRTIKCLIFDAITRGEIKFVYPGRLTQEEARILQGLGYRIERVNASYLISF